MTYQFLIIFIEKIPKPQTPLKEDIVSDILAMESKLANLGTKDCLIIAQYK